MWPLGPIGDLKIGVGVGESLDYKYIIYFNIHVYHIHKVAFKKTGFFLSDWCNTHQSVNKIKIKIMLNIKQLIKSKLMEYILMF